MEAATEKQPAYVLGPEEGQATWFAGALMILKADGEQTQGRFACMDQHVPGDYAVPRHLHRDEDEAWYVLQGDVVFHCGEQQLQAGAGSWVFLPMGVPHAFRVGRDGARLLTLTSPARFADFVRATGEPAQMLTPPPAGPMDVDQLASVAARFGIEILGPPPA